MGLFRRGPSLAQLKSSALQTSQQAQAVLANADRTRADVEAAGLKLIDQASQFIAFLAETVEEVQKNDIKLTADFLGQRIPITLNIDLPGGDEVEPK